MVQKMNPYLISSFETRRRSATLEEIAEDKNRVRQFNRTVAIGVAPTENRSPWGRRSAPAARNPAESREGGRPLEIGPVNSERDATLSRSCIGIEPEVVEVSPAKGIGVRMFRDRARRPGHRRAVSRGLPGIVVEPIVGRLDRLEAKARNRYVFADRDGDRGDRPVHVEVVESVLVAVGPIAIVADIPP